MISVSMSMSVLLAPVVLMQPVPTPKALSHVNVMTGSAVTVFTVSQSISARKIYTIVTIRPSVLTRVQLSNANVATASPVTVSIVLMLTSVPVPQHAVSVKSVQTQLAPINVLVRRASKLMRPEIVTTLMSVP